MDAQSPSKPKGRRIWTSEEEHQLLVLHTQSKTWDEIAQALDRTVAAVQPRYHTLRNEQYSSAIDWTPDQDDFIISHIDAYARFNAQSIADELGIPKKAVFARWRWLQAQNRVPEEVLALTRRQVGVGPFTKEEDEVIWRLWQDLKNDDDIFRIAKSEGMLQGRSKKSVCKKRKELAYHGSMTVQGDTASKGGGGEKGKGKGKERSDSMG
ncbi:hypothetical protein BDW02DRAFT_67423 [Decorospora gaudefroyi]|uniref:Myb-like domain-containing protein n=1 Tax=Decorospora gaudefroyi TaxID=184978 RepID=A0A6A5KPM6_9PLEO|nr:hypothetical protein BDW02DRAFT_67423 [Decorospora gaudefroyi]